MSKSEPIHVQASGPIACFTRPEFKAERMSYEVMTPSAARGVLEAVLWKPQFSWAVERIAVCAPIRWTSFRRNEVNSRASARASEIYVDHDRAQRNTVALRDVNYVISARIELTNKAGSGDTLTKYVEMFRRRVEKGQHFHAPYLGCREFAARVSLMDDAPQTIDREVDRPLGVVFYDYDYSEQPPRPLFFHARLHGGVVEVPERSSLATQGKQGGQP